jgi:hypothetical protein
MYNFTAYRFDDAKVGDSIYVVGKYDRDPPSIRKITAIGKTQITDDKGGRWSAKSGKEWGSGDSISYAARAYHIVKLPEAEAFLKEHLDTARKEREVQDLANKIWRHAQANGFFKMDVERLRRIVAIIDNKPEPQPEPRPLGEILREGE